MSFTDPIDQANYLAEMHNQLSLERQRSKAAPEQDGSEPDCIDCGEPIGPERLALGRCRCFECQSRLEKQQRRYGK